MMEQETREGLVQNRMIIQDYRTAKVSVPGKGARPMHTCPVCGESSVCFNIGDKYHSCGLCGSVWQDQTLY